MNQPLQRLVCAWCQTQCPVDAVTCLACGAPLDVKNLVSDSGWRAAPRLKDMTEIRFGNSSCQVEGELVPVAEITLGEKDTIYFEHHVMLWKDESVVMGVMPLQGGVKRALAGMPFIVSMASGQGAHRVFARRGRGARGHAAAPQHGARRPGACLSARLALH